MTAFFMVPMSACAFQERDYQAKPVEICQGGRTNASVFTFVRCAVGFYYLEFCEDVHHAFLAETYKADRGKPGTN